MQLEWGCSGTRVNWNVHVHGPQLTREAPKAESGLGIHDSSVDDGPATPTYCHPLQLFLYPLLRIPGGCASPDRSRGSNFQVNSFARSLLDSLFRLALPSDWSLQHPHPFSFPCRSKLGSLFLEGQGISFEHTELHRTRQR